MEVLTIVSFNSDCASVLDKASMIYIAVCISLHVVHHLHPFLKRQTQFVKL